MDEATASIDIKTEQTIQTAIHNFLSESTIITIAHRIKTIINYDLILVLRDGNIIEYDEPGKLIEDRNSLFYELYSKSQYN
jgi:ABC-type multidrug transport system fused ATPase/permease subunit